MPSLNSCFPSLTDLFNYDSALAADGYPAFGGLKGRSQPRQDPAVERDLLLTLEEVYNGCIKKMEISRKVRRTQGAVRGRREKGTRNDNNFVFLP